MVKNQERARKMVKDPFSLSIYQFHYLLERVSNPAHYDSLYINITPLFEINDKNTLHPYKDSSPDE